MLMKFFIVESNSSIQMDILNLKDWFFDTNDMSHAYSIKESSKISKTTIHISSHEITFFRNGSAEVPLFFFLSKQSLFVSDSISELQSQVRQPLDFETAYTYIYSQFLPKQKTLFTDINQVLNDQKIVFSVNDNCIEQRMQDSFELPMHEFEGVSEQQLTQGLRENIIQAHSNRLGNNNAIFLSGGLDSQVMGITLSKDLGLAKKLSSLHFTVKGARHSELSEAELTAKSLNIPLDVAEIDASQDIDFNKLMHMNAPYIGAVSISQLLNSSSLKDDTTVFAGQDTRLHTPSLRSIDEKLLRFYGLPFIGKFTSLLATNILAVKNTFDYEFESSLYRKLSFFAETNSREMYLTNRFFHITSLPFQNKAQMNRLRGELVRELTQCDFTDKRVLFNQLVIQLWRRQFIYDINYMYDTVTAAGHKVAMPFYDKELAKYSAQLPFNLAAKMTKGRAGHGANEISVNKYLLRKAYEGELDNSLVYRDKAVCLTSHMFFNGGLSAELENFIDAYWIKNHDIAKNLGLPELQKLCRRKHKIWLESDHWLMMTIFNALIVYNHLRELA